MDISADLPAGLGARPLTSAGARGVYQVMADLERAEIGSADIEEADIVGDWQQPSVDVPATTMGVFDEDRLVGYAEAAKDDGPPGHRRRVLGVVAASAQAFRGLRGPRD